MVKRPDAAAVDRIIAAVGKKYTPDSLERGELRNDLDGIASLWIDGQMARSAKLRDLTDKIAATAERLREQLDEYDGGYPTPFKHALRKLLVELGKAEPTLEAEAKDRQRRARILGTDDGASAIMQLVGLHLGGTYEDYFEREAGSHKPPAADETGRRETGGPFIRFADQAMLELGITNEGKPYSRKTIANALDAYRKLHKRHPLTPKD